jgi:hypothetical protein
MRSTQKDLRRTTVLTTLSPIPNASAGDGVFSDGTPWHSVRTAAGGGEFNIYFDPRLVPLGGSVGGISPARVYYIFEVVNPGNIRVQCYDVDSGVDATFDVTMTCLDTRT